MQQATKTKLFARVTFTTQGEFLGVRKAKKTLEENKFSSRVSFAFQTVLRTVCRRKAPAAQERLQALKFLLAIRSFYGDRRRFLWFSL